MLDQALTGFFILIILVFIILNTFEFTEHQYVQILFWGMCIPARGLLVIAAKEYNMRPLTGLMTIGFASKFAREQYRISQLDPNTPNIYGFGDGFGTPIYWHQMRLMHAIFHGLYTFNKSKNAYLFLVADLIMSIGMNIFNR